MVGVTAGYSHTVALLADGSLACWGHNESGECDLPTGIGTPENPVLALEAGGSMTVVATAPCDLLAELFGDAIDVPSDVASLRHAISLACDGTTIRLAPGTYENTIHLPIDFQGKAITIEGDAAAPSAVVLDGTGLVETSVVKMVTGEGPGSVLRGVTIRNGTSGTPFNGFQFGGGLFIDESSPRIEDCIFAFNASEFGAGIYVRKGAPTLRRIDFHGNVAIEDGGGLQLSNVEEATLVEACAFTGNEAGTNGGAMHLVNCSASVTECTLAGNQAGYRGGGISFFTNGPIVSLDGSDVSGNIATFEGGIARVSISGSMFVSNTTICDNSVQQVSAGLVDVGGNCISESCDSDGDGILDCDDPCPDWPHECSEDGQTVFVAVGQSIQIAIEAVPEGGSVELAAGVHVVAQPVRIDAKPIVLVGANDGSVETTIDGQGVCRVLEVVGTSVSGSRIERVRLSNGRALEGGAVMVDEASCSFLECEFISNTSERDFGDFQPVRGGAALFLDSEIMMTDCVIRENMATGIVSQIFGGGACNVGGDLSIIRCHFDENTALGRGFANCGNGDEAWGGGLCDLDGGRTLGVDSTFSDNLARGGTGGGCGENFGGGGKARGGGYYGDHGVFDSCTFVSNMAQGGNGSGPALYDGGEDGLGGGLHGDHIELILCTVDQNTAIGGAGSAAGDGIGGGIFGKNLEIIDCILTGNMAVGADVDPLVFPDLEQAAGGDASGGGIHGGGTLEGTILEGNGAQAGTTTVGPAGIGSGGGLRWTAVLSTGVISDATITGNFATIGAGIHVDSTTESLTLTDTTVCDNVPDEIAGEFIDGGGNDLCACPGDYDGDGVVGGADLGAWLVYAGDICEPGAPCPGDLDGDGEVRGSDLGILLVNWGMCP